MSAFRKAKITGAATPWRQHNGGPRATPSGARNPFAANREARGPRALMAPSPAHPAGAPRQRPRLSPGQTRGLPLEFSQLVIGAAIVIAVPLGIAATFLVGSILGWFG
jgi:hypothetical protein